MQNLYNDLIQLLQKDERFTAEGKLLKNTVIEAALQLNPALIKLLLSHETLKKNFFQDVDGVLVFDKIKFQKFVSNKSFLPDSYTAFSNKIGLTVDDEFISESKEVVLSWPHKDCILEGGQTKEDEKRNEIFWNETLAHDEIDRLLSPKVFTNFKKYDAKGEHKASDITLEDNLIIKGNNLLALYSLLPVYRGRIKLICIDPPYNTGNDSFQYNDSFNHSTWLIFMKNRLEVAKQFLKNDGFIIIHCDFIEDNYLKILMDEIFTRDNYINTISVRDSHPSGLKLSAREKTIIKTKSSMLVYRRTNLARINPIYQRRNDWDTHFNIFVDTSSLKLPKYSLLDYIKENKIIHNDFSLDEFALRNKKFREFAFNNREKIFQSTKEIPEDARSQSLKNQDKVIQYSPGEYALNGRRLSPLSRSIYNVGFDKYSDEDFGKLLCDFWDDVDFNNSQNEGGISFPTGKKPEFLLARLISMFSNKNDYILDFNLGSGTTAAVSHKLDRRFIGIEQIDYGINDSVVRLKNVINSEESGISKYINWKGGGSFIYCELAKLNQNFVDKITKAKTTSELKQIWETIKKDGFISYKVVPKEIDKNISEFEQLSLQDQKKFLIEVLDKNHLYVNYSEIDDKDYKISEEDKRLNKKFYSLK